MTKTSDNLKLDESEEVYEYLLVSVCPVALSKPGLGYRADENRIGARIRDWVVGQPELGFLYNILLNLVMLLMYYQQRYMLLPKFLVFYDLFVLMYIRLVS